MQTKQSNLIQSQQIEQNKPAADSLQVLTDSVSLIGRKDTVNIDSVSTQNKTYRADTLLVAQNPQVKLNHQPHSVIQDDWITAVLFGSLILFAVVVRRYAKYFYRFLQSFLNSSIAYRMYSDRKYPVFHGAYLLQALFYIILSLFLFAVIVLLYDNLNYDDFSIFLLSLAGITLFFMIKKILYSLLGFVLNKQNETSEFLFSMDNYERIIGLFLLPIVAFIFLNPFESVAIPMLLGLFIVSAFYVAFLLHNVLILVKKQFSIFYLFLYLCTLEILPLLLVAKWITEY